MRKPVLFVLLAGLVALAASTAVLYQKLQKSTTDYATLQADAQATRNRYGQAINEISAIQDSLNTIVLGAEGVQTLATELDREKSLSHDRGDDAMARINVLRAGIERTKDKITDLETRLQKSGVQIAGLQKMITGLRRTIAEREEQITHLTARVDSLQTQVTGLVAEVQTGQQTIQAQTVTIDTQAASLEERRRELGTIFYTIGSKKELTQAGLIVSKGGVLGLGKTLKLSGQIDESRFTAMDTDQETLIRIPSKKARVLSDQPPSSYELQVVGEEMELHILDAKTFRTVKHVVIMTT